MRILFSLLFISIILSKTAFGIFWQINFYLNQKEIAATECENKNRPELHCNGKCFLAKQLQKAEAELDAKKEKQSGAFSTLKVIESNVFIPNQLIQIELPIEIKTIKASFFNYRNSYILEKGDRFFHPPISYFV